MRELENGLLNLAKVSEWASELLDGGRSDFASNLGGNYIFESDFTTPAKHARY